MIADIIPIIEKTMTDHNVRSFGAKVVKDPFGTEMVSIHGHFNDLRWCDHDKMLTDLRVSCGADVAYGAEVNEILVRPLPENRPGTVPYRFGLLLAALDQRFPEGAEHRKYCAEPPESHLLREIDRFMDKVKL